jgi:very-short-patch-repair endonuclease
MIITKKVSIKLSNRNIGGIKKRGYDKKLIYGENIDIDLKYMSPHSHIPITVKCDNCDHIKELKYYTYNRMTNNDTEPYYCNKKDCINKKREISLEKKYGVKNVFQLGSTKEKIKLTNLEKYGVENPQQNKIIKEKTEQTNILKYGNRNVFQNVDIKEKIKKTNNIRYGVNYPQQSEMIRSKYSCLHKSSKIEKRLLFFIKENYEGEILINKNNIISGYEIDIYLPELKLAFEFNGLYWHNELTKDKNYHKMKTDLCEEKGVQLIHVWEDDWEYKQDIVKSIILNRLERIETKIFAKETEIREITDNNLIKKFLNINHLQGFVKSKIKIGLFHNNDLVSLMTFGKTRKNTISTDNEYEMLRFCNKLNTNIIDSESKLFDYFIKKYNPNKILSHVNRSYSNYIFYEELGFKLSYITKPNYYYIIRRKRINHFEFRKNILIKQGFDKNKSEHQIMLNRKIYRIYDAGNYEFVYDNY